jgi:hypothetical protein
VDEGDLLYVAFKWAEALQRRSPIWILHSKADFSQQGASSSGFPPWEADSISQSGVAEKTTRCRESPVVRNLPLPFTEDTSLGASGSGIPPQGDSSSSIPVDWEPVVLVQHHREMAVPANPWTRVIYNM